MDVGYDDRLSPDEGYARLLAHCGKDELQVKACICDADEVELDYGWERNLLDKDSLKHRTPVVYADDARTAAAGSPPSTGCPRTTPRRTATE